jgi:peptide/nickel transport system permease protein
MAAIIAEPSRWTLAGGSTATRSKPRPPWGTAMRRLTAQPSGILGLTILLSAVVVATMAPAIAPHDPVEQFATNQLAAPSLRFPFGTDAFGRDVLSRVVFGTRLALFVGVIAVALGAGVGVGAGLVAGYFDGATSAFIMRVSDALFAVPAVVLGLALAAALGASSTTAALTIGITAIPTFARLTRAGLLAERPKEYVLAARVLGAKPHRVLGRHIVPNILAPLLVQVALTMAAAVLLEAGLSFIGLGTQPPTPSWGVMLADSRKYLRQAPWYGVFPGLCLALLVIGLNSLADAARDALDPHMSTERP